MSGDLRWSVYVHTNKINGKRYVGITSAKPSLRWGHGLHYTGCRYFYYAIQKYGWDNFDHEIIISGVSKRFAEEMERGLIEHFKTRDHRFGYNIQPGGISNGGLSPEGLQSIRDCNTGVNAKNRHPVVAFDLTGKKVGEFACIHDAEKHYGGKCFHQHVYSRHGTRCNHIFRLKSDVGEIEQLPQEVVADALSKKYKNGVGANARSVSVFDAVSGDRLGVFPTIRAASKHFKTNFSGSLYYQKAVVNRYIVKYTKDCDGIICLPAEERGLPDVDHGQKPVFQFSLDRTFIREYPSLRAAADETGVNYKGLSLCLRKKARSCGGFLWSYSRGEIPEKALTASESRLANGMTGGTAVDQIDLKTGMVVATYPSIGLAAKAAGTYKTSISQIINHVGNHVSAGGYGWKYHSAERD